MDKSLARLEKEKEKGHITQYQKGNPTNYILVTI